MLVLSELIFEADFESLYLDSFPLESNFLYSLARVTRVSTKIFTTILTSFFFTSTVPEETDLIHAVVLRMQELHSSIAVE